MVGRVGPVPCCRSSVFRLRGLTCAFSRLHYIPLSSSYSEIYNIHAYFSGPSASTMDAANATVRRTADWEAVKEERDAQLRQIARAGKQWKQTLGRTADMEGRCRRLRTSSFEMD